MITDQNQVVVWRWENSDPFGTNVADEDPDGNGIKVTCNLRFPGQYFDKETGNHYNYFRDYSPDIGRYIESDPIGLRGGSNTYGYVDADPLSSVDLLGLAATKCARNPFLPECRSGGEILAGPIGGGGGKRGGGSVACAIAGATAGASIGIICKPKQHCRLYDATWVMDPTNVIVPNSPNPSKPVLFGGTITCFYDCPSGNHYTITHPTLPGLTFTKATAMAWCGPEAPDIR